MFFDLAQVILQDGMVNLANDVAESQAKKGLKASGASAASLRPETTADGNSLSGKLYGSVTFTWQQNGRKPNKSGKPSRALVEGIEAWMKWRGMSGSPWGIATNIAKYGITVPNANNPGGVLSEPLAIERVKAILKPRLKEAIFKELKSTLFTP